MEWDRPSEHTVKTWGALVSIINEQRASGTRNTIRYGDLALRVFGARNKGAQSFGFPLGNISERIRKLNQSSGTNHPLLNALVFDLQDEQKGIPFAQDTDEIWLRLNAESREYLDELGRDLGYVDILNDAVQNDGPGHATASRADHRTKTQMVRGFPRITINPSVMSGKPCIRGMRVTVGMILGNLGAGVTIDGLLQSYPYLEREDVFEALRFAAWLASDEYVELESAA